MLQWYEENGKHLGLGDGYLAYRVYEDEDGWTYEDVVELVGYSGYDTAEEAIQAAEADYEYKEGLKPEGELDELLDVLTDDDEEAYWDMVAHERMEAKMGW